MGNECYGRMILQTLADTSAVGNDIDAVFAQMMAGVRCRSA